MEEEREIGIPPDHCTPEFYGNPVFPMSEELPAGAWHINDVLRELHKRGIDGRGVTVSINDTGGSINASGQSTHPFLPAPVARRDFTNSSNGVRDVQGHGTHCAGITRAVAPRVDLMYVKVLGDGGSGSSTGINAGRVWAGQQKADIVSESLGDGGGPEIPADLAAYDKAYEAGVKICVAALGNAGFRPGVDTTGRPGSYFRHCHGIAALDRDWKTPAGFSSAGRAAVFIAPGNAIISCKPGGGWTTMGGTSTAAPYVAGVHALVLSWRRQLGFPDLVGVKEWTEFYVSNNLVTDLHTPGQDVRTGHGLIDIQKVFQFLLDRSAA